MFPSLPPAAVSDIFPKVHASLPHDFLDLLLFIVALSQSGCTLIAPCLGQNLIWLCLVDIACVHFWDALGFGENYEEILDRMRTTRVHTPLAIAEEPEFIDLKTRAAGGVMRLIVKYPEIFHGKPAGLFLVIVYSITTFTYLRCSF